MPKNDFEKYLKEAQEAGAIMQASGNQSTRAHSVAMTHLETAQLWARQDMQEKERIAKMQEQEPGQ